MPREQGESGEFVETIAPEDVLQVFDAVDGPVILSADVADYFEVTRETARRKLQQLHDQGELDRRKVSRRVIYWRAEREGFDTADLQGDATTTLADTDAAGSNATEPTREGGNAESGRTRAENPVDIDSLSFDRDLTLARREQLREWIRHAANHDDGVSKSDFGEWWTDERAGETGYNSGSFWEAFAKSAMKQSDRFSKPDMRTYRYVGDESTPDESTDGVYDPTDEFES